MNSSDGARLIYLSILLVAVVSPVLIGRRGSLGRTAQQFGIWVLIFLGFIAVYGLWPDLKRSLLPRAAVEVAGGVELRVAEDGHFYADILVNGQPVTFLLDTGASEIVLSPADARKVGFDPAELTFSGQASTANGTVTSAPVKLDSLALGPYEDRNLNASVNGAEMDNSLLGMSYLRRYQLTFTGSTLRLVR